MTIYSENDLYHCLIKTQSDQAFDEGDISKESCLKIKHAYLSKLYTPHFFIAVALGLLTVIAVFLRACFYGLCRALNLPRVFRCYVALWLVYVIFPWKIW